MSQPIAQMQVPNQPQFVVVPVRETNGLGVAGFFIALIGLFIPTGYLAVHKDIKGFSAPNTVQYGFKHEDLWLDR